MPDAPALYGQADMVLRVGRPTDEEITFLKPGTVLIGTLGTLANPQLAERLAKAGITAISMDAIPRITRAQSMDTLELAGHGGRLQGRPAGGRAAAEVHAAADHRRGHGAPGAGPGLRRRRGRA